MNDFKALFQSCVALLKTEFTLYGFTMSWWQVFFWSAIVGIVIWFLKEVFS